MKRNDPAELRALIGSTRGRIFSVLFVKKDLTGRRMRARLKVLEPETYEKDRNNHILTVWDLEATAPEGAKIPEEYAGQTGWWRSIPLDRLVHFKCGDLEWITKVESLGEERLEAEGGAA